MAKLIGLDESGVFKTLNSQAEVNDYIGGDPTRIGTFPVEIDDVQHPTAASAISALADRPSGGGGVAAPTESIDPWQYIILPSNVAVSTVAFGDVTGMSFVAQPNTRYEIEFMGALQSAANTTGAALAIQIPSGTVIGQGFLQSTATASLAFEQIANNNTTGVTTGVRAVNTNTPIQGKWIVSVGATGGPVQLRMRSEIAASAVTLQAGLSMMKWRVADRQSTYQPIVPMTAADYAALPVKDPKTLYVIVETVVTNPNYRWVTLTQAQYNALAVKDPETLYVVEN